MRIEIRRKRQPKTPYSLTKFVVALLDDGGEKKTHERFSAEYRLDALGVTYRPSPDRRRANPSLDASCHGIGQRFALFGCFGTDDVLGILRVADILEIDGRSELFRVTGVQQ